MALAAVLSAMRTIILDAPSLPDTEGARRVSFRALFPVLSAEEIEDLAKISPDRFRIYTRSIFNGESGLIERYYALTCAMLGRTWEENHSESFSVRDLMRALHAKRPWKTATTEGLVENFGEYLKDLSSQLGKSQEQIIEAARFEREVFYARRGADETTLALTREELAALTVGQVLNLTWSMPATSAWHSFNYDIAAAYTYFNAHSSALPSMIAEREHFLIFGRDVTNTVRWREISKEVFQYFEEQKSRSGSLGELAEHFVGVLPAGMPEEQSFVLFLEFVVDLVESGIISLNPNS